MSVLGTVPVFPGWGSAESLVHKFSKNEYFSGDTGNEDSEAMCSTHGTSAKTPTWATASSMIRSF